MALMKSNKPVGIVGYGAYVPRYRLPASEVSRVWTDGAEPLAQWLSSLPADLDTVVVVAATAPRGDMAALVAESFERKRELEQARAMTIHERMDAWRKANPLGAIGSVAAMLEYSFGLMKEANAVNAAIGKALDAGRVTADLKPKGKPCTTEEVGAAVSEAL